MIIEIQKRWEGLEKKQYKIIADEFSISILTAKKYVHMTKEEISALDYPTKYKQRKKTCDGYLNMIFKMCNDKIQPEIIVAYVIHKGYKGTLKALTNQIEHILKNNFGKVLRPGWWQTKTYPEGTIIINRSDIIKYITVKNKKIEKDKTISQYIVQLKEKYPIIQELETIYNDFYSILMGNSPELLDSFIEMHKNSCIKGFIDGIKKDIAPVKNAISLPISSGFVEGNNNKFKLVKRILYGRSKLVNLFRKCYLPFMIDNVDFKITECLIRKSRTLSHSA